MTHNHNFSTGMLISTLAFAGVALALMDQAMMATGLRAVGLWLAALACLAAALRYRIAAWIEKWRG